MNKPGGMVIMIGEHRPKDAAPADDAGMDVGSEARTTAVNDLAKALGIEPGSVDTSAAVKALSAFMRCGPAEGSDEEEAGESPDEEAAEDNGTQAEKPSKGGGMYR